MKILSFNKGVFLSMVIIQMTLSGSVIAQIPELVLPDLREGETIVYLDSLLKPVGKESASFYTYTFYHMDKDVWRPRRKWMKKSLHLEWTGRNPGKPGAPVALQGTALWFNKSRLKVVAQEQFFEGRYSGKTIEYDHEQRPSLVCDYDKKWNTELWSFYLEKYSKGELDRSGFEWYSVADHKWNVICTQGCYVTKDFRP